MDYERVLKHWEAPLKGRLAAFHEIILSESFKELLKAKNVNHQGKTNGADQHDTWDNGYMSLYSGNAWAAGFLSRIGETLRGGLALKVSILIMSVNKMSTTNLVTTCVAVSLVAVVLATFSFRCPEGYIGTYGCVCCCFWSSSLGRARRWYLGRDRTQLVI